MARGKAPLEEEYLAQEGNVRFSVRFTLISFLMVSLRFFPHFRMTDDCHVLLF